MDVNEEYRRRADDCLRLARLMPTEQERRNMLAAAKRWRALAGDSMTFGIAERSEGRSVAEGPQVRHPALTAPIGGA